MSSAEWMIDHDYKWMTEDQRHCYRMLCDWAGGDHHLGKVKEWGMGVATSYSQDLSTFDFNRLTTLVFMAHDRCIRVEIGSSGPRMVRIILHKRHTAEGDICRRHPTLAKAIEVYRRSYPEVQP